MALREEKVVLLIADISGYTDFMLANEKSLEHSHLIISELIKTILEEVELPLTLAKLEGDAIFLYAVKNDAFGGRAEDLGARVLRFFHVFSNKVAELTLSSFCKCGACTNIETLKLKVIVHSGRCTFYQIANLTELSGVDVIVLHRLLKNSVGLSEYVLLTEAAQQDLQLPLTLLSKGEEAYDGIGTVQTYVYSSPDKLAYVPDPAAPAPQLFLETLRCEIKREYAEVATNPTKGFHFHTGRTLAALLGYSDELLEGIPEESISRLAGTGNPFALGPLHPGETVVELGCGAGMDTLIASLMVGPNGRVISIDMTPEMLDEARAAASLAGATNIDFHLGYIENIPLPDASADVIISNGVINLAPDKKRVFREMHRVLKPEGRLQIGDIIVQKAVPESAKRNIDLWAG
jgi:2-polyprenyl-3-methyl-5-hydroxy-6-metoxy-1,4-benzoquinol methylase